MLPIRRLLIPALLATFGLVQPGCGPTYPETIPVSGTVTCAGQPLAGAAVVFTPEEGQQATGTTDNSGRFELSTFQRGDGALPGKHRVTIVKTTVEPGEEEKILFLVPKKFGNPDTSGLTCQVRPEMAPVPFDLPAEPESAPEPQLQPAAEEAAEPTDANAPPTEASEPAPS